MPSDAPRNIRKVSGKEKELRLRDKMRETRIKEDTEQKLQKCKTYKM